MASAFMRSSTRTIVAAFGSDHAERQNVTSGTLRQILSVVSLAVVWDQMVCQMGKRVSLVIPCPGFKTASLCSWSPHTPSLTQLDTVPTESRYSSLLRSIRPVGLQVSPKGGLALVERTSNAWQRSRRKVQHSWTRQTCATQTCR